LGCLSQVHRKRVVVLEECRLARSCCLSAFNPTLVSLLNSRSRGFIVRRDVFSTDEDQHTSAPGNPSHHFYPRGNKSQVRSLTPANMIGSIESREQTPLQSHVNISRSSWFLTLRERKRSPCSCSISHTSSCYDSQSNLIVDFAISESLASHSGRSLVDSIRYQSSDT
jgi:hypothetical protein